MCFISELQSINIDGCAGICSDYVESCINDDDNLCLHSTVGQMYYTI